MEHRNRELDNYLTKTKHRNRELDNYLTKTEHRNRELDNYREKKKHSTSRLPPVCSGCYVALGVDAPNGFEVPYPPGVHEIQKLHFSIIPTCFMEET